MMLLLAAATQDIFAQLPTGSMAPQIEGVDLNGNPFNLQELYTSNQEVVIMFFAAWSPPDWNYINTNALQEYDLLYGPTGAGEVRIVLIEADLNTTVDDIMGLTETSQGDYSTLVDFPIIDDNINVVELYQLSYYPTIYRVCPNGTLSLIDQQNLDQLIDQSSNYCVNTEADINPKLSELEFGGVCQSTDATIKLTNLGTQTLTSCDIEVTTESGYSNVINWTGSLATSQYVVMNVGTFNSSQPDVLSASVISTDEVADPPLYTNLYTSPETTSHIHIDLLTDNYPDEISWVIYNSNFEPVVTSEMYTLPQTQYIHDIFLSNEDCYTITIDDWWGDGLAWPGDVAGFIHIQSVQEDGDLVPIYTYNGDYEFTHETASFEVSVIVPISLIGHVFHDLNENGYPEESEPGIGGVEVHLDNLITYTDEFGNYIFNDVDPTLSQLWFVYDNTSYPTYTTPVAFDLTETVQYNYNLGLSNNEPYFNMEYYLEDPWFFCGSSGHISNVILNNGNQVVNGVFSITLDPLLQATYSDPPATSVNGNVLTWNLNNLGLGEAVFFYIILQNPGFEYMGNNITNSYFLQTTDLDNNVVDVDELSVTSELYCSYDPNDKTGMPAGETDAHFIPNGTDLEYVIRFQNTGNYQAFNIHVKDVIDEDLDLSTLQIISTSHYCQPTINTETREVDFFFPDIMLADSATHEEASHGFIRYRISPWQNLPELTTIENTAYIYFDFNPAIITNTTLHTVSDLYFGIGEWTASPVTVYPNPTTDRVAIQLPADINQFDVVVMDMQGRMVTSMLKNSGQKAILPCESLPAGSYMVRILVDQKEIFKPAMLIVGE